MLSFVHLDIKYDEEKEEKIKQEKKQQELTAIEEAIKYAEEAKNKSMLIVCDVITMTSSAAGRAEYFCICFRKF